MLLNTKHPLLVCSDYALWAAVVTGTKLGLLQLDSVLLDVIRTLNPSTYRYTSTAQSVLDWFQVTSNITEHSMSAGAVQVHLCTTCRSLVSCC